MEPYAPPAQQFSACYRHPDRITGVRCQRCGRPVCPECATDASVGVHCAECMAPSRVTQPRPRSLVSASVTTVVIGAINVAVWGSLLATGGESGPIFSMLALHPEALCLTDGRLYVEVPGAACVASGGFHAPGVMDGAYWQLLTATFTHVFPMHLLMNMVSLWFLGPQVEAVIGRARFLALYLVSALAGSVAVYWLAAPDSTTLGASGAVFGLLGSLSILTWKLGGNVQTVLVWLGLNVAFTFLGGPAISWQGHLGGLVGGMIATGIMLAGRRRHPAVWTGLAAVVVVLVVLTALRTSALT